MSPLVMRRTAHLAVGDKKQRTMTDCIYQFLEHFQTLIVGVIGFSGVVLTLLVNAWLLRRQHAQAIKHEMSTLRTALIAELELIEKSFREKAIPAEDAEDDDDEGPSDAFHPGSIPQPIYENFVGKIGLLSKEEVSAVIEAYTLVNEAPSRLQLLSSMHDPSSDQPGYIFISAEHEKTASGIYASFLPTIGEAVAALKSHHEG